MTKITRYPEALDNDSNLPDIDDEKRMNQTGFEHDVQHTLVNQAVIELQKKVGADKSEDEKSLDYRVGFLEEHGTGGAGLMPIDEPDPMLINPDETQIIPEHPSIWLQATINGKIYAIPAFEVITPVLAPENFESQANATLYYPKKFSGETEWEGEFDGNDII